MRRPSKKLLSTDTDSIAGAPSDVELGRAWIALVVIGIIVAAGLGGVNSTGTQIAALAVVELVSIGAVLLGARRYRPAHPGVWLVLAVSMFVLGLGSILANLDLSTSRTTSVALFQGSQAIGYPLLFFGLLYAARTRRETNEVDSLLDGMILGTAFGFLVWRSLLSHAVDHAQTQPFQLLVATLVPALDVVIVVGLLRRMLSGARTAESLRLLLLAVVVIATNHVVSGLAILNESGLARHIPIQALSFTLLGAAALHPSMQSITRPDPTGVRRFRPARIGILALALLITPGVILLDRNGSGQVDTTMLIGASCISMIVMIRLISLAREADNANQRERTRERRFESLVRNSSDLIAVLDPQHRLTYVSPAVTSMLGFSPDDALGVNVLALFHHDDRDATAQALDELGEGETSELRLVRLRHREGTWRWVEVLAVNLTGEAGIAGTVVNCRDVTERVAAEKLLLDTGAQQSAVAQLGREALSARDVPGILASTAALIRSTLDAGSCQILRLDGSTIIDAFAAHIGSAAPVADLDRPSQAVVAACLEADDPIQFADRTPDRSLRDVDGLDLLPIDITRIGADHQLEEIGRLPRWRSGGQGGRPEHDRRRDPRAVGKRPTLHRRRGGVPRHDGPHARPCHRTPIGRGHRSAPGAARQPHHAAQPGALRRSTDPHARLDGAQRSTPWPCCSSTSTTSR